MHQPFTLMQYNKLRQKDTKSIDAQHKDLSKIYGRKKFAARKNDNASNYATFSRIGLIVDLFNHSND